MTLVWGIASLLLVLAFIGVIGFLGYMIFGIVLAVREGKKEGDEQRAVLREELRSLEHGAVKRRLRENSYFSGSLRATPTIQDFFFRLDNGEEVSLASRYPEKRLYRLLVKAEHEAGLRGRPEAIDHVGEISDLLQELARKSGERT